ncbi:MAG: hypothetical protein ACRC5T_13275, partial [Cetobacterium sp.]
MERILDLAREQYRREIEDLKRKYDDRIVGLKAEHSRVMEKVSKEHKIELEKTHTIRWDGSKKYFCLTDFCRNMRGVFFIKETELKQYLLQTDVLSSENGGYIGNGVDSIDIDGELYVSIEQLRKILTLRSLVLIGEDDRIDRVISNFKNNKDLLVEQMANTVYVQCKQKSEEFKLHRENVHYMQIN